MSAKKRKISASCDDFDSLEPVANRTRLASLKLKETPKVVQVNKHTILDVLNEDCWRLVLDHVNLEDIMRSERVSKEWQRVVHRYMRGVHLYVRSCMYVTDRLKEPEVKCRTLNVDGKYAYMVQVIGVHLYIRKNRYHIDRLAIPEVKCRVLDIPGKRAYMLHIIFHLSSSNKPTFLTPWSDESATFVTPGSEILFLEAFVIIMMPFIQKYGPAIVVADCLDEAGLRALGKYSPDLEELRVRDAQYHNLKNRAVQFDKLRRLIFEKVIRFKDGHISKLLGSPSLESLVIYDNNMMTGTCLSDLNSNLKTLQLDICKRLDINHLISASHRLRGLTKLDLNVNSQSVMQKVYKLLRKTPNLEYLSLEWYESSDVGDLVEAICGLSKLKHLSLESNQSVRDAWLDTLGLRCRLRCLDVGGCERVTVSGIESFCRGVGKTLTALGVAYSDLADADVARCVALCPNLQMIDLTCAKRISRELPATLSTLLLRRRPLRLRLWGTEWGTEKLDQDTETYPNIILDPSVSKPDFHEYYNL